MKILTKKEYYRFLSSLFIHQDVLHFLLSGVALQQLGSSVERLYGPLNLLLIYLVSGGFSNVMTYLADVTPLSIGGTGAIFGLLGAQTYYYLANRQIFSTSAWEVIRTLGWVIASTQLYSFFSAAYLQRNLDDFGHLAGLAGGWVLAAIIHAVYSRPSDIPKSSGPQTDNENR